MLETQRKLSFRKIRIDLRTSQYHAAYWAYYLVCYKKALSPYKSGNFKSRDSEVLNDFFAVQLFISIESPEQFEKKLSNLLGFGGFFN